MDLLEIIKRLSDFGYEYDAKDEHAVEFAIDKTTWTIKNFTNQDEIPEGLMHIAIDMACADFLKIKNGMGQISTEQQESVVSSVKSVKLGDTTVTFSDEGTPEQQFYAILEQLWSGHNDELIRYRKMVW